MSLELILGPMFAGKTSALQSIIRRHEALGIKCAVYKPVTDTRYGEDFYIYSHDKTKVAALPITYLTQQQRHEPYTISKLIVIEEGQFFDDLYDFVLKAVERDGKHVVVGGLDGDCFRKPFGQILQLIPLADRVTKLNSLCKGCGDGTIGLFTFRTTKSKEIVEVGGSDSYMPLCRKHYLDYTAIQNGDCPECSSGLAGSVYRPRCSECPWTSDTSDSGSSIPSEPLPTIQVRLVDPPTVNQLVQTTPDICQTSQFV
jgi:thymidine kinase